MKKNINLSERTMSDRLRKLRLENDFTQAEIAEKLFMDVKAYGKYERAATTPSIDTIVFLAKKYNVSTDYILTGKKESASTEFEKITENCTDDFQNHILNVVRCMVDNFQ